jgi:hypothetical protein
MTKRKSKSKKSTVKAAAAKTPVTKSSVVAAASPPLIVLGFDDQQKPRGARFVDAKPDLVAKAAAVMGFKVYQASLPDVAAVAKKLPLGRLYANGRGFVPNIRQSLYTDVVAALAFEPQTALSKNGDKDSLPAARGLPRSGDDIAAGHLVIAQESLEQGWHEAIVLDRKGDTFILQYRDYPHLPKFARQRRCTDVLGGQRAILERDRVRSSRNRSRVRQRWLVGSNRDRPQSREPHVAVSRLPKPAQDCSASVCHCADVPGERSPPPRTGRPAGLILHSPRA